MVRGKIPRRTNPWKGRKVKNLTIVDKLGTYHGFAQKKYGRLLLNGPRLQRLITIVKKKRLQK
jgi:hypothetical protein